jgi:hypothetical protein
MKTLPKVTVVNLAEQLEEQKLPKKTTPKPKKVKPSKAVADSSY